MKNGKRDFVVFLAIVMTLVFVGKLWATATREGSSYEAQPSSAYGKDANLITHELLTDSNSTAGYPVPLDVNVVAGGSAANSTVIVTSGTVNAIVSGGTLTGITNTVTASTLHAVTVVPVLWASSATLTYSTGTSSVCTGNVCTSDYFPLSPYIYSSVTANNMSGAKLQLAQGDVVPNPQNTSNGSWVITENMPDLVTLATDNNLHRYPVSKATSLYGRMVVTGSSMVSGTTLTTNYVGQN